MWWRAAWTALLAFVCYIVLTGGFKEHLEARLNTNSQNLVPSSLLGEGHPIGSARERIAKSIPMFLTESVSVIDLTKEIEPPSDQRTPQNLDQFILGKPSVGYDMTVERKLRCQTRPTWTLWWQFWEWEIFPQRMVDEPHYASVASIKSWCFPGIDLREDELQLFIEIDPDQKCRSYHEISSQLALSGILHRFERIASSLSLDFGSVGGLLSCISSNFGVVQAFANENELPKEKGQLANRNNNQPEREESYGLVRKPMPPGFVWLTFAGAIGSGLFFGGVGYLVYRFGGRRDKTPASSKPHYRPEKWPD